MKRKQVVLAMAATFLVAALPAWAQPAAPAQDPYAWLEPQHGPAAVAWAKAETDRTLEVLKASPSFPAVERELKAALKTSAPLPNLFLIGDRFVRFERSEAFPQGRLQVAPRSPGRSPTAWRTVLDLAALNKAEGGAYALNGLSFFGFPARCLPPAYDRCLLPLSPKGSSSLEYREFDLAKGDFVKGGFHLPAIRAGVAYPPVLLVTSTEDNQVGPAHARKFAAKLQADGAKAYLIEDPEGGHGVPDQLSRPDLSAAQMVFFIDQLMKPVAP